MIALTLQGQQANHWFEYSFLRILASHSGYEYAIQETTAPDRPLNRKRWYSTDIFSLTFPTTSRTDFRYYYYDVNGDYMTPRIIPQDWNSFKDDTLVQGVFQGRDIIERIDANWFPTKELSDSYSPDICIIHFRGTDTLAPVWRPTPALLEDIELYYIEAQNLMRSLVGNQLKFIVVTDDIPAAQKYVKADDYINNSAAKDFSIMFNAAYLIIPNSTFSWWAGFLSKKNKICIAPSGWFFYKHKQKIVTDWCYTDKFTWI